MEYNSEFMNQYLDIPEFISNAVDDIYTSEKDGTRYCIKLIITNLLQKITVAYSLRKAFFAKYHTKYYTRANPTSPVIASKRILVEATVYTTNFDNLSR